MTKAITTSIAKGCTGRPRADQTAHKYLHLYFARPTAHFPPQCPGEHMGGGAPANEAVEIAPSSTSVASIKRIFMGSIPWDIAHHIFFAGGNPKYSKNARWKTTSRRSTDRLNRGLNVSDLWLDDDSALIPDSSLTLAGGKLRSTPALH
jgi:hypothetical protein